MEEPGESKSAVLKQTGEPRAASPGTGPQKPQQFRLTQISVLERDATRAVFGVGFFLHTSFPRKSNLFTACEAFPFYQQSLHLAFWLLHTNSAGWLCLPLYSTLGLDTNYPSPPPWDPHVKCHFHVTALIHLCFVSQACPWRYMAFLKVWDGHLLPRNICPGQDQALLTVHLHLKQFSEAHHP